MRLWFTSAAPKNEDEITLKAFNCFFDRFIGIDDIIAAMTKCNFLYCKFAKSTRISINQKISRSFDFNKYFSRFSCRKSEPQQ